MVGGASSEARGAPRRRQERARVGKGAALGKEKRKAAFREEEASGPLVAARSRPPQGLAETAARPAGRLGPQQPAPALQHSDKT